MDISKDVKKPPRQTTSLRTDPSCNDITQILRKNHTITQRDATDTSPCVNIHALRSASLHVTRRTAVAIRTNEGTFVFVLRKRGKIETLDSSMSIQGRVNASPCGNGARAAGAVSFLTRGVPRSADCGLLRPRLRRKPSICIASLTSQLINFWPTSKKKETDRVLVDGETLLKCWFPRTVELFDEVRHRLETWRTGAAYHRSTDRGRENGTAALVSKTPQRNDIK
ncbi:hypothetical protein EVAR_65976_1 [Eumeta japonica]|uniref:Uncharacterized protein n=1 Tax=Eumeta variegata TaxID=151549 RepID=A0A4C1ZZG6_EUMVA|nr:hypothetical protein EVAR_65976_1 [Eumeta japonica]